MPSHRSQSFVLAFVYSLSIALLLAGCGQSAALGDPESITPPIPRSGDSSTPTLSSLDATKQADDRRWEAELATAQARYDTATPEPRPFPTDEPSVLIETGSSRDCESLYSRAHIDELNCWAAVIDGHYLFVAVGAQE